MRHYDGETFFEYVDGSSPIAARIERHAASCESCAAVIAECREIVHNLGNPEFWAPVPEVSADFRAAMAAIFAKAREKEAAASE